MNGPSGRKAGTPPSPSGGLSASWARAQRVGIVTAMSVVTLNIWTGAPLLGLWVGSRLVGDGQISMAAMAGVVLTIFAACFALVQLLAVLGETHNRMLGRERPVRQHLPWLRSMRGERQYSKETEAPALTALEYVLVGAVLLCYLAFEIWFFFYSSSPIDQRSGR